MATFDESKTYTGRIAYIQASAPDGFKASMFVGKLVHKEGDPVGDGRLWEMVDCDIIVIPRKRYVQSSPQVMSIDSVRTVMGKMDEWKEVDNG